MKWLGKWKALNILGVHGEVSINILRERKESDIEFLPNPSRSFSKKMKSFLKNLFIFLKMLCQVLEGLFSSISSICWRISSVVRCIFLYCKVPVIPPMIPPNKNPVRITSLGI